jgi:hypothetical protein
MTLLIADCKLQTADCGLQIAIDDCRLTIADCKLRIAIVDCKLEIVLQIARRFVKWIPRSLITVALVLIAEAGHAQVLLEHPFEVPASGEVVASISAACESCDWGAAGREAIVLKLMIDDSYSQHVMLLHGSASMEHRVLLGSLTGGPHRLVVERDAMFTSKEAGSATLGAVKIETYGPNTPEHEWLSRAPILYARPGTVERFTDVPLMMYAEADMGGYRYSVIFSHEDGGTPTDRLMATWGRATDIEFVYGFSRGSEGTLNEEYQGADHAIVPFSGARFGTHPLLWVSTVNNMIGESGPQDAVRFAPAPQFVRLGDVSREVVMDANPWTYSVMAAELAREGRIDPDAAPGSGNIADPRRFAIVEACGDVRDATLAFELAVEQDDGTVVWYSSDRGEPRFRIARSGCFRGAAPLPDGVTIEKINGIRVRAYTRPPREQEVPLLPGTGRVMLRRLNAVLMLDDTFKPVSAGLRWMGSLAITGESAAIEIPVKSSRRE